jgi:hypothetical protein
MTGFFDRSLRPPFLAGYFNRKEKRSRDYAAFLRGKINIPTDRSPIFATGKNGFLFSYICTLLFNKDDRITETGIT